MAIVVAVAILVILALAASKLVDTRSRETTHASTVEKGADLSFLPQRFVAFELETTGLDPARHEIIEIGAIKVNRGQIFMMLFRPSSSP